MSKSQNGWPVLPQGSGKIYVWTIPAKNGAFKLRLRNGSAGFLLAHFALWYSETIEDVSGPVLDDWGYAYRPIRGQESGYSNHSSGTAMDLNALKHPLGKRRTGVFRKRTIQDIVHARLRTAYKGAIRWGGDYHNRADEMHWEIVQNITYVEKLARRLAKYGRGLRIIRANPTQKRVIG